MAEQTGQSWECVVCGFVHRGPAPPDSCPVCGASRSEFKRRDDPAAEVAVPATRWRCLECGYIHTGPRPPDECPVCGATADRFEPVRDVAGQAGEPAKAVKVVVVGAGIAGVAAVESIRATSSMAEITLISGEANLPYQRLNLTRFLAGEITHGNLPIHPVSWYEQRNVRLLLGRMVERVELGDRQVFLSDGESITFEKLVLATGATAVVPPIPGVDTRNVLGLRTLEDAQAVLSLAKPGARCVCIGGGILGLETAGALARRGVEVTVIENQGWLLSRQLNERAAQILETHVRGLGIKLCYRAGVAEITGDSVVRQVRLQDGSILPADFVVLATGIRPETELARSCGLAVNRGVLVNDRLETSNPDVLAAGDGAEHRGTVYGLWVASQVEGNIAGLNAVGHDVTFKGIPRSNFLKVLGVDLFSVGVVEPDGDGAGIFDQEMDGRYLRFVFKDNRLVGAILLGDTRAAKPVKSAVEHAVDLRGLLAKRPAATDILGAIAANGAT